MCSTIDEEGRHVCLPAERRRCVVDRELCERQLLIPVVLAAVGIRSQRVADNSFGPLHLGVGILVVRRADGEAPAHALREGPENLARELGVAIRVHDELVTLLVGRRTGELARDELRERVIIIVIGNREVSATD